MTDKAKDERVESALPPDEADYRETSALPPDEADYRKRSARERTSALPPDRAAYRARSARERTSALPPDRRDLRERGSVLPPDYHDPEKSALPPDDAAYRARSDRERTSALPPDCHDPEKSALPPDKANHPETLVLPPEGEAPARQEAERYYAEYVQLAPEAGESSLAVLQEALNKGARQSRKVVGVVHDPTSQANVILVWDTEAFISR